jgi:uncharacterized membrane protein YfcA
MKPALGVWQGVTPSLGDTPDGAFDYPHVIALILVVVILTASVEVWSARRRGDEGATKSPTLPLMLVSIAMGVLFVFLFYFLPAAILTVLIRYFAGKPEFSGLQVETDAVLKLAFMICLTDTYIETQRYEEKRKLLVNLVSYAVYLPLSYYGGMVVAWILARIMAAGGGFGAKQVEATSYLFSMPVVVHNPALNWAIIGSLILSGALLLRPLIEWRR